MIYCIIINSVTRLIIIIPYRVTCLSRSKNPLMCEDLDLIPITTNKSHVFGQKSIHN